jgi:hypothetical protein
MERIMPKRIVLILTLIITGSLVGCNLPDSTQSNPDIIATQVSNLLTTTPEISNPTNEDPTLNIPTITVELTEVENQPSETATFEPTITRTVQPPGIPTGSPSWSDSFDNGARFGINPEGYDDGQTRIIISDGSMILTSISASGWRGWRVTSQKPGNYYLKADFQTEDCVGSDQYGLVIQSPDFESGFGYYFGLTCDGRYAFQKWEDGGLSNLQGWTNDTNINPGTNQNNSIGILKSGNQYNLFVNNVALVTVDDEKFSSPGYFGPFIAGVNTANFSIKLNEIAYWNLP